MSWFGAQGSRSGMCGPRDGLAYGLTLSVSCSWLRDGDESGDGDMDGLASWEQEPESISPISTSPFKPLAYMVPTLTTLPVTMAAPAPPPMLRGVAIPPSVQGAGGACSGSGGACSGGSGSGRSLLRILQVFSESPPVVGYGGWTGISRLGAPPPPAARAPDRRGRTAPTRGVEQRRATADRPAGRARRGGFRRVSVF